MISKTAKAIEIFPPIGEKFIRLFRARRHAAVRSCVARRCRCRMASLAGLLLDSVVPSTLIVIAPTNERIQDRALGTSSDLALHLLRRWGHLHAVRSGLSLIALMLMIFLRP